MGAIYWGFWFLVSAILGIIFKSSTIAAIVLIIGYSLHPESLIRKFLNI